MKYNYLTALEEDIKDWCNYEHFDLSDYNDIEEAHEYLHDELWEDDSVTGNGDNWYANTEKCEEYLCGNWDLILNALDNFCIDINEVVNEFRENLPQYLDRLVRLDLLDVAIENVLEDLVNMEEVKCVK